MIKERLGKKAADSIERSKYGQTKIGKISSTYLDEERSYSALSSVIDEMQHPYFRRRIYWIAGAINLTSWVSVFFLHFLVSKVVLALALIFSKGGLLLIIPAFSSTLLAVYALFRGKFPETVRFHDESDVMQSYQQQSDSTLTWKIWVAACGLAAVNAILLTIVYLIMTGEWQP